MFALSQASLIRLVGVHPDLTAVVQLAIQLSTVDFKVVEGVRTVEQALTNWGKGRSQMECIAMGVPIVYAKPEADKVTWVRHPLSTLHLRQSDGYGHAVDLLPAPYDWKDLKLFDEVAFAMFRAASQKGVHIRWGADWDEDGRPREKGETDNPHFELRAHA